MDKLEVLSGKPESEEGGTWVDASIEDIEVLTEDPSFNPKQSGYTKYLNKWQAEGLITPKERDTGRS